MLSILNLLGSLLVLGVAVASHCPDKSCQFTDNEVNRNQNHNRINIPWRLSDHTGYTLSPQAVDLLNIQINLELNAFYTYTSMAYFFARDDVGLNGFHEYFKKAGMEEISHAQQMMAYMNARGAPVRLGNLTPECVGNDPPSGAHHNSFTSECDAILVKAKKTAPHAGTPGLTYCDWSDPLVATTMARQTELKVYDNLLQLHHAVEQDVALADFIENFLEEQVTSIKGLSDLISQMKRVEPCVGYYLIDKDLK